MKRLTLCKSVFANTVASDQKVSPHLMSSVGVIFMCMVWLVVGNDDGVSCQNKHLFSAVAPLLILDV